MIPTGWERITFYGEVRLSLSKETPRYAPGDRKRGAWKQNGIKTAKAAVEEGMSTLRMDGWRKVLAGKTSVDEVLRITKGDQIVGLKR